MTYKQIVETIQETLERPLDYDTVFFKDDDMPEEDRMKLMAGYAVALIKHQDKINSLIQEIKQDPTISISQRNYAIKKMEELKKSL